MFRVPALLLTVMLPVGLLASCNDDATQPSTSGGLGAGNPLPGEVAPTPDPGWAGAAPQEFPVGSWIYKPEEVAALFGPAGSEPLLTVRCEGGMLRFERQGDSSAGGEMRLHLSTDSVVLQRTSGVGGNDETGLVSGEISLAAAEAAGLIDESQAYAVEADGLPAFKVPATPMIGRLAADCRETSPTAQ